MTNFSIGKLKFFKREVFFVQVYYDAARKGTMVIPLKFQYIQLPKKFNHMTARIATCTVTFALREEKVTKVICLPLNSHKPT